MGFDYTRWAWRQRKLDSRPDKPPAVTSLRDNMLARVAIVFGSLQVLSESTPGLASWQRYSYRTAADAQQLALWQMDYYRRLADDHDRIRLILTREDLDQVRQTWSDENESDNAFRALVVKMKGAEPVPSRSSSKNGWIWPSRSRSGLVSNALLRFGRRRWRADPAWI